MSGACKKKYIIKMSPFSGGEGPQGPPGPPGPGSDITLPITTDDVTYHGDNLTDVLDNLLYTALVIANFQGLLGYEKGRVLTSISMTWAYNKAIQVQTITGPLVVSPTLLPSERAKVVTLSNVSSNTTMTLTADDDTTDDRPAKTYPVTITFYSGVYWGVAAVPGAINSAFILSLVSKQLRSNRTGTFTVAPGENQYIWFACPHAQGTASFKTNGFNGGLFLAATISFTNSYGFVEDYDVYRSNNPNLGSTFVEVL